MTLLILTVERKGEKIIMEHVTQPTPLKIFRNIELYSLILILLITLTLLTGCTTPASSISVLTPSSTSTQLLTDRSAGVLHDRLTILTSGDCASELTPRFSVFNRTMHTLTIELSGSSGSYTLLLEPKRDHTWLIREGSYHVEISVPGFPPAAADGLSIAKGHCYKWELWKDKP